MKRSVAIIGGGASALAAAAFLNPDLFDVTIYEKNKSFGRKFLVAGKGGFNLTHSEEMGSFISKYSPKGFLDSALSNFTNNAFRTWLDQIGIPTFVGSSKRIYPEKGIKPITVLNRIMTQLETKDVQFEYEHEWGNWDGNDLVFVNGKRISPDIVLFSLGGGSWKVTGSDGSWLDLFLKKGIQTLPFAPSNCAFQVDWKQEFISKNAGQPVKNSTLSCGGKIQKGEVVLTKFGIEGNAIYALSNEILLELSENGSSEILFDFKPSLTVDSILDKMIESSLNTTQFLKQNLKLSQAQIQLLKSNLTKEEYTSPIVLASKIKSLPIVLVGAASIDEAISTTGGIATEELDDNFELKKIVNSFCIGEMINWNVRTGGYLLQACFSMGVHVAHHLNQKYES